MAKDTPKVETDDIPVADEEIATHQEAVPVPYLAGTRRIAVRWISPALDMQTREVKQQMGKK